MIPILFDRDEMKFTSNGICRLYGITRCIVTEERNGIYECEFDYPMTGEAFHQIEEGRIIGATHDDNGDLQPFDIYGHSAPMNGIVTFYAHHLSYRLRNYILNPKYPVHASSCTQAMAILPVATINTCPFSFYTDKATVADFDVKVPTSIREILSGTEGSILDVYGGGEYEFDKWTVNLYQHRGNDNGVEIRYGKNLLDLKEEYDESGVYTAVIPYWYDEENDILVMPEDYGVVTYGSQTVGYLYLTNEHGVKITNEDGNPIEVANGKLLFSPLDLTSEFDEQPTKDELIAKAQETIDNSSSWKPSHNITVSFAALWQTTEYADIAPLERVSLCDTVKIVYDDLGIEATEKVIKTVYNVLLDRYDEIELGDSSSTYASLITEGFKSGIEGIKDDLFSLHQGLKRATTADYVLEQIDAASEKIRGGLGGYVVMTANPDGEPEEILVMDTPSTATARNVIRINKAGIGFSTTGYAGPFNSAWTIDGTFNAQHVNVVNLAATVLRTGYLTDIYGKNYWNLETGEFRLSDSTVLDQMQYVEYDYKADRIYNAGDYIRIITESTGDVDLYEVSTRINTGQTLVPYPKANYNIKPSSNKAIIDLSDKAAQITSILVEYAEAYTDAGAPSTGWTTEVPTWDWGKFIWQRIRTVDGLNEEHYSTPSCLKPSEGSNGVNTTIVNFYRRADSTPTISWTNTLTYTFSARTIGVPPEGWSEEIPEGTSNLYVTSATADSATDTSTITYAQWSSVVRHNEDNYKTRTITLYQRGDSASSLTKPTVSVTYNFATGEITGDIGGWSKSVPEEDGRPCYYIYATAASNNEQATIARTKWSTIKEYYGNGRAVASVINYYSINNSNSTIPDETEFGTDIGTLKSSSKYLWHYKEVVFTDNTAHLKTEKKVITTYQATKTIRSITTRFLVTASNTGVTKNTSGWSTTVPRITELKKWLWYYDTITYTDNTTESFEPEILTAYGKYALGLVDVVVYYSNSTSKTSANAGWTIVKPEWSQGHYIWMRNRIYWTNSTLPGSGVTAANYTETSAYCLYSDVAKLSASIMSAIVDSASTAGDAAAEHAIDTASTALSNFNASLDQQNVFNRLTNNGNTQGIFLDKGQLYINGTWITTGVIQDARTPNNPAKNIWNLNNGSFKTQRGQIANFTIEDSRLYAGGDIDTPSFEERVDISDVQVSNAGDIADPLMETIFSPGDIDKPFFAARSRLKNGALLLDLVQSESSYKTVGMISSFGNGIYIIGKDNITMWGNLLVAGDKNRMIATNSYSNRLLYSYETTSPMFGDIGSGIIGSSGTVRISIEPVFRQTVDTSVEYQVFLQKYGDGDCYVSLRNSNYFIVTGTPGLEFGWEVKAKQADAESKRLTNPMLNSYSIPSSASRMLAIAQSWIEYIRTRGLGS